MKNSKNIHPEPYKEGQTQVIDFIAAGIGCNCLIALSESGVLNKLKENNYICKNEIKNYHASLAIKSALVTLDKCNIVKNESDRFSLTSFGHSLLDHFGLIEMLFEGYGDLMAQQNKIVKKLIQRPEGLIRGKSVSKAAVELAIRTFDPIILREFANLKFHGTICDLGCGLGRMLSKVCKLTGNPGLGFDSEPEVVCHAKQTFEGTNISIELGNIVDLQGIWEDVVVLMQCHVFHDFTPNQKAIRILNSYLKNFPNLKYFYYLDTVSSSENYKTILPGFDYVHGLLGIETRTHEETLTMFEGSDFRVMKEVIIENLPNTYLWILAPRKQN